jgi:hypothetical protein|tara:strand:+ start:87 stop:227 length:141 start_codon:yes stop_codon:yes gene_type:complete
MLSEMGCSCTSQGVMCNITFRLPSQTGYKETIKEMAGTLEKNHKNK